jgi:hypothetical protein
MSWGTIATAAGNGPRRNCSLHSSVKVAPRRRQSAVAGLVPLALPVA